MEKVNPFGGWSELSKRIANWEEQGCPEDPPWKFCRCPLPESDWSFAGWHMCLDSHGHQTAYQRCPEYLENHTRQLGDGTLLTFSIKSEDPHKVNVYRQFDGRAAASKTSIIE